MNEFTIELDDAITAAIAAKAEANGRSFDEEVTAAIMDYVRREIALERAVPLAGTGSP